MSTDLKTDNKKTIFSILVSGILVGAGFQIGFTEIPSWKEVIVAGTASPLISAVLIMLTNLIPHDIKHKLIFTRLFNEMPAGRIHKLIRKDPRLDVIQAQTKWPEIFAKDTTADQRNSFWYQKIYKPVKEIPGVQQSHRDFLLYRDVFSGFIMLFLIATGWHWFGDRTLIGPILPSVFYILGIFTFLSLLAARFTGKRFVINAVAAAQ
ncbi:hypothetical protein [Microbulbifer sp. ANSA005]|uniref:hypothetical protein n=1 Tax=Microbulbifer sp. ANSA005 TaxID=3243362 RepID=UPI004042A7E5